MLNELNPEKVCTLIIKAREWDVQVEGTPDDASNATDDGFASVMAEDEDDSVKAEFSGLIAAMNDDERDELVALCLVGRGDYTKEEWDAALAASRERDVGGTADYLLSIPLLPDYLEEGLAAFDFSCEDYASDRL